LRLTGSGKGERDVPLISIRTSGFVARIRTQYREHCGTISSFPSSPIFSLFLFRSHSRNSHNRLFVMIVIDTHPDHQHTLRLDTPFPALQEYADGLDLEKMDSMEHGHIPFVLLLIRALKVFRVSPPSVPRKGKPGGGMGSLSFLRADLRCDLSRAVLGGERFGPTSLCGSGQVQGDLVT
jgi:hypothetical protein